MVTICQECGNLVKLTLKCQKCLRNVCKACSYQCQSCKKSICNSCESFFCEECRNTFCLDCATSHSCNPSPTRPTITPTACMICFEEIIEDEEIIECPFCHYFAHKNHILSYLAKHDTCPYCSHVLPRIILSKILRKEEFWSIVSKDILFTKFKFKKVINVPPQRILRV